LTGSFGSGKTTVARFLQRLGAKVIDADSLAHESLMRGAPAYRKAVRVFGRDILNQGRSIDRRKLAAKVFCDRRLLSRLNRMIHPEVIRKIRQEIRGSTEKIIVLDVPLLVEAGLRKYVDKLVVVSINRPIQIKRVRIKTGLKGEEILCRIKCQLPLATKIRLADFVIDNNGSLSKTRKQVLRVWKTLRENQSGG